MKPSSRDRVTHRKEQKQGQGLGGTPAPSRKGGDSAHRFWSVHRPLQPLAPGSPALPQGLLGVSGATRSGHRPSSAVEPGALGSPHPAAPCVTSRLGLSSRSGRCQNDCSTLRRSATSRPPFSQNLLGFTWQVLGLLGLLRRGTQPLRRVHDPRASRSPSAAGSPGRRVHVFPAALRLVPGPRARGGDARRGRPAGAGPAAAATSPGAPFTPAAPRPPPEAPRAPEPPAPAAPGDAPEAPRRLGGAAARR